MAIRIQAIDERTSNAARLHRCYAPYYHMPVFIFDISSCILFPDGLLARSILR